MKQAMIYLPLGIIAGGLVLLMFLVMLFVEEVEGAVVGGPADVPGISRVVLQAYVAAAARADDIAPGCEGMTWSLVAAIGSIETNHGTHDGAEADEDGDVAPEIYGPTLDGSGGNQRIDDTDDGEVDGDEDFDRAVGPMQFIPGSWNIYGQDGNEDGEEDPHNVFDAAAATVSHLCDSGDNDLTTDEGMRQAIRGYNNSDEYVTDVMREKDRYDSHHVGSSGAGFTAGELVQCDSLNVHPDMCWAHERLTERFGVFYVSAGGQRNEPGSDHGNGQAIDYMMSELGAVPTPEMHGMAILVINYVIQNHEELRVKGLIYDHHIWNAARDPVGPWEQVRRFHQDTGNNTQDHVDHIHLAAGPGRML